MNKISQELAESYRLALAECCRKGDEKALQKAYEIGRRALENGYGVLDIVTVHHQALDAILHKLRSPKEILRTVKTASKFFTESVSFFALIQGGFQEAIATLKKRTADLSLVNAKLEMEVLERKHTEEALKKAYEILQNEIYERKKVEKAVLEISQKEQRRFGQELHDSICQNLVGISMLVQSLTKNSERGQILKPSDINKIAELLDQSIRQARNMAHGCYPVELEADSLMIALEKLVRNTEQNFKLSCKFHGPEPILFQNNNVATQLYWIAKEAIMNAIKHGKAKNLEVRLVKDSSRIFLHIKEDGQGLPMNEKKFEGIGLQIMKYRASVIGGDLQLKPNQPKGTIVICILPLDKSFQETEKTMTRSKTMTSSHPSLLNFSSPPLYFEGPGHHGLSTGEETNAD